MLSAFLSRIIILVFGTLYPAYASYKAVKTKNLKEYVKWMMYWIVFALFICVETFADVLLAFWMPLYYEMKILFLFWLLSPWTKGSSCLYRKFVHPELSKREKDIDDMVSKARAQGYTTLVTYGAKGLTLASKFVAEIAMKGQYTLMNQLRKSQSLNDISPHRYYGASGPMEIDGSGPRRQHPYYLPSPQAAALASSDQDRIPELPHRFVDDDILYEEEDFNEGGLENDEYGREVSSILANRKKVELAPLPGSRRNRPVYNTRSHQQQSHDIRGDSEDSKDEGIYATVPRVGKRIKSRKPIIDSNTGTLTKEMTSALDQD